jgi:hypothetical protein
MPRCVGRCNAARRRIRSAPSVALALAALAPDALISTRRASPSRGERDRLYRS